MADRESIAAWLGEKRGRAEWCGERRRQHDATKTLPLAKLTEKGRSMLTVKP